MRSVYRLLGKNKANMEQNNQKLGWFYKKIGSIEYYTHKPIEATIHYYAGDGSKDPTPKQIAELFAKYKNGYCDNGKTVQINTSELAQDSVNLPFGCYRYIGADQDFPSRLLPTQLREDKQVHLGKVQKLVEDEFNLFIKNEQLFRDIGIQYRRGILLYGLPGCGKTVTLRYIVKNYAPPNSIIIFLDCLPSADFFNHVKLTLPDVFKIFVFEELAAILKADINVERMLDFLDGETSLDKSIIFATTNYPDRLPGNIVDRPSRFDKVIKVGNPDKEVRTNLLKFYLGREVFTEEINLAKDLSVASIKEVCMTSRIKNLSLKESVSILQNHKLLVKKEFDESKPIGLVSKRLLDMPDDD